MLESLFNKSPATLLKRDSNKVVSCEIYENFEEYLRTTASVGKRVLRLLRVVKRVTRRVLR